MLPREHRITRSADFRATMRRGARAGTPALMAAVRVTEQQAPTHGSQPTASWRCGLIVSKAVGNSVVRHRTQRRLRHIIAELLNHPDSLTHSLTADQCAEVVIRAHPEITGLSHSELTEQLDSALRRAFSKTLSGSDSGARKNTRSKVRRDP